MLERKRTLILEVRDGLATPESIALEEGREMEPTSVGARGAWRVEGEGVLDVHLFLCFDGGALFVQSTDLVQPARVDGRGVPADWTEVHPPATIALGPVSIVFRSLTDTFDDTTDVNPPGAGPPPSSGKTAARPFAPGAFARSSDDAEATRLQSSPRAPLPPSKVARPLPAAGRPALPTPAPNDEPTRIELPSAARTPGRSAPPPGADLPAVVIAPQPAAASMPTVPRIVPNTSLSRPIDLPPVPRNVPAGDAGAGAWIAAQWRAASGPKRALVMLMPLAAAAVFIIFFDDEPPPPARPRPAPSAAMSASATPVDTTLPAASSLPLAAERPIPTASAAPTAPTPSSRPASALDAGANPLERAAVDAVAAGAYAEAIRAYDQLAVTYPDRPAYAEAARILRARVGAGR